MTRRARTVAILFVAVATASMAAPSSSTPPSAPVSAPPAGPPAAPPAGAPPGAPPHGAEPAAQQVPWPIVMGLRALNVESRIPVLDRVVLVSDEATYLDEVSRWSPAGQWPVLFEERRFAPRFIRAFKPKEVLRRTDKAAPLPEDPMERRALLERTLARMWGMDSPQATPLKAFQAVRLEPPGMVITRSGDPAWVAAIALAGGRGQLLGFADGSWGSPSDTMDAATFAKLAAVVTDLFRDSGVPWSELGDPLDACTLCMATASRCTPTLDPSLRFSAPGAPPTKPTDPLAVTDCLGRHADGRRFAVCSTIWGDAPRCAAAAMSSLFLERASFTFVNSYGESGDASPFGVASVEERFEPLGYRIDVMVGPNATLRAWQRFGAGGMNTDALFVNSSGDCFNFDLGTPGRTPPENRGHALDVPVLDVPLALQFVHSFSMESPGNPATIGARWLDHGVYAGVGSVFEPFMSAFVPPMDMMERLAAGIPFLVAARQFNGPFAVPWRIMTFGDPLMLATPPSKPRRHRVPPDQGEPRTLVPPGARALASVRDRAAEALRACKSEPAPSSYERAFLELEWLGDDAITGNLWQIAAAAGPSPGGARAALGALYRMRDTDAFLAAFRALPEPDGDALDMLWGLMTPRLSVLDAAEIADLLAKWPRPSAPQVDLARLAPAMARLRGTAAARAMLLRASEQAKDPQVRDALRQAAGAF